jgi:hypothetical protein
VSLGLRSLCTPWTVVSIFLTLPTCCWNAHWISYQHLMFFVWAIYSSTSCWVKDQISSLTTFKLCRRHLFSSVPWWVQMS